MTGASKQSPEITACRCRCGHDKRHPLVRPKSHYGTWGMLIMGFFGSPTPRRIDFACATCGEVVGSVTDRQTLSRFRHREPLPDER